MVKTLYTKRQTLALLYGWGYSEGTLPQRHRPESLVSIAPELRTNPLITRARITFDQLNSVKQRLYGVEFIA
jgi:hypothetical protein